MTLSVSTQTPPVGAKLTVDTDANATAQTSVTGASGTIYMVEIDNSGNSDNACYLKIYDDAAPVVGTTAPTHIFCMLVNQSKTLVFPDGLDFTNLSYACVISGGTSGTTAPTNAVTVKIVSS